MASCVVTLSCYFLLFTAIDVSAGWVTRDATCLTAKGRKGQCIAIGECPPLLNLLKKRPLPLEHEERLRQSHCGFEGIHPKVCCSLDASGDAVVTTPQAVVTTTSQPRITTTKPQIHEPPLNRLLPSVKACGTFLEDRVFLGDEAQLDGYPWTVLLQYEKPNGYGFHCGGVLINKRYVLTAAHCISGKNIEENWKLASVRLGEYDRDSNPDCDSFIFAQDCCCTDKVIDVEIEEKIVHEQYDPNNKAGYYDIALLRLADTVTYSDFVRPICLQPTKHLKEGSLPGELTTISGWGITELRSNSNKKQWSKMQIKNNTECENAYAKKIGLPLREDQICAFAPNGKTSCSQDSGGALMKDHFEMGSSLNYFAVGVMSIGHPICGLNEYPVIYTKVESYIPWIISKMKQ